MRCPICGSDLNTAGQCPNSWNNHITGGSTTSIVIPLITGGDKTLDALKADNDWFKKQMEAYRIENDRLVKALLEYSDWRNWQRLDASTGAVIWRGDTELKHTENGYDLALKTLERKMSDKFVLSASEALFGFGGWLTSRDQPVTFSASHDAAQMADLIQEFILINNLDEPRDGWHNHCEHPQKHNMVTK